MSEHGTEKSDQLDELLRDPDAYFENVRQNALEAILRQERGEESHSKGLKVESTRLRHTGAGHKLRAAG